MMTTRVRRRRPRVPPRKRSQPLPQFGAGADPIDLANFTLGMLGITPMKKQRGGRLRDFGLGALHKAMMGGRLTREQASMMKELMMATDPRRLGIFPKRRQRGGAMPAWFDEIDRAIRSWHNPNWKKKQRGSGLFSIFTRPLARLFGKKMTKQAVKAVAKRVAKKAAKKAATGAVTAGASWATQKALDRI